VVAAGVAPQDALDLSLEEIGYVLEVSLADRAAWFAPLAADPAAYLASATALNEQLLVGIAEDADAVERFVRARDAAYGRTEV